MCNLENALTRQRAGCRHLHRSGMPNQWPPYKR
jgi:hypothetical protein